MNSISSVAYEMIEVCIRAIESGELLSAAQVKKFKGLFSVTGKLQHGSSGKPYAIIVEALDRRIPQTVLDMAVRTGLVRDQKHLDFLARWRETVEIEKGLAGIMHL